MRKDSRMLMLSLFVLIICGLTMFCLISNFFSMTQSMSYCHSIGYDGITEEKPVKLFTDEWICYKEIGFSNNTGIITYEYKEIGDITK